MSGMSQFGAELRIRIGTPQIAGTRCRLRSVGSFRKFRPERMFDHEPSLSREFRTIA